MSVPDDRGRRPLTKVEYVVERLRDEIQSGIVSPGSSLRQQEIAERYGVSATPVREAFRRLEADGIINHHHHRGASVADLDPSEIHDLYRLRAAAEGGIVELAVGRLDETRIARIVEAHDRLAATKGVGDAEELSRMNRAFHFAIYETVAPIAVAFLSQIWTALPSRLTIWDNPAHARVLVREHRRILDAILAQDAAGAGRLMSAHIMTSERYRQGRRGS